MPGPRIHSYYKIKLIKNMLDCRLQVKQQEYFSFQAQLPPRTLTPRVIVANSDTFPSVKVLSSCNGRPA